jgi:predicted CXXCH cytochrome family protein
MLLVYGDVYELCTSCHDGTGAITNVVDGYYEATTDAAHVAKSWKGSLPTNQGQDGHGLFGGGFVNARMLTDFGNTATQTITTNSAANANTSATAWAVLNAYDTNSVAPAGRPVTSAHKVGQTGAVAGTVWGSGGINSTGTLANNWGAGTLTLECTSCHNPHGAAGKLGGSNTGVPIPSYRLLDFQPVGSNGFEAPTYVAANGFGKLYWDQPSILGVTVPDVATKWYTPNNDVTQDPSVAAYSARATNPATIYQALFAGQGDYAGRYYLYKRPAVTATTWSATATSFVTCGTPSSSATTPCAAPSGPVFNNLPAQDVLGFWCATCHDRYLAPGGGNSALTAVPPNVPNGGSRTTDSGDPGYHFRHRSQGVSGSVTAAGVVTAGTYPGTGQYTCLSCHNAHGTVAQATALSSAASYASSSALLKADNRAVCIRCHATAVNFFNTVTTPGATMVYPIP